MSERNDDLSPAEREAFSNLPREHSPRTSVEEQIVAALRSRGLIRAGRGRPRLLLAIGAAAAGLAILAAGFLLGRGAAPRPAAEPPSPRFALFLLRGEERLPERPEEEAGRVAEYRAWARALANSGRFVTGEKLEDRAEPIGPPASGGTAADAAAVENEIRGFFVISASDFEDALAVARGCPHLHYGGRILVRPITRV
jgi:hypothetical protein